MAVKMILARLRSLQARLLPNGILDVVRQVLLFAVAYYGYRLVRGWIDDPQGATVAFDNARHVIHVEQTLGFFVEPSVQAWASTKPAIIDFASWMYLNCQSSVTVGSLVFLYLFHNKSFYFVRNMFMVAMGIALVGYTVLPTAPPRLARLAKHRITRIAWSCYPLLVTFVIVATGNHFLSDAILGALTAAISAAAATWLARARPAAWAFGGEPVKA